MEDVKSTPPKRGRPFVYNTEMARGSFRLPTPVISVLRKAGDGNLTRGIIRLAKLWEDSQK